MQDKKNVKCLILTDSDNVGVIAADATKDQICETDDAVRLTVPLQESIARGHKIATKNIRRGEQIIKFGQIIGISRVPIQQGAHVHNHNIDFIDKTFFTEQISLPDLSVLHRQQYGKYASDFKGFKRKDGRAGIRNYIVVASTVNCSATVVKEIARHFKHQTLADHGIDGIVPLTYSGGCAQATDSYANRLIRKTIAGWVEHPNVVASLMIGLGCEAISTTAVQEHTCAETAHRTPSFNIQDHGGTRKSIHYGIGKIEELLSQLPSFERTELPVSLLTLGLNCGGSDAFSGISANPALGVAGDILVSKQGTIVLAEVPECHGAEDHLIQRCVHPEDKDRLRNILAWWDDYARKHDVNMNDNLAPGNKAGGITTILEKSLGAVAKAGSSPIQQVVDYAERITKNGLVLMNTPGFDPVSVTGLVAGGCNVVAFTTGRGSTYGASIAPTIKISTTSELFKRMQDDIDVNAGKIFENSSIAEMGGEIYEFIIKAANGVQTCSERNGLGWEEFVPWQVGETL